MKVELILPVEDYELAEFIADLNAKRKAYYIGESAELYADDGALSYEKFEKIEAVVGPKYIRVSVTQATPPVECAKPLPSGRYAKCTFLFIDRATGNILKPNGYATPAKGVRGNIRDEGYWMKAVTPHGAAYLR